MYVLCLEMQFDIMARQGKDGHCSERGPVCLRGISRGGMQGVHPPPPLRWHTASCDPSSSLFPLKICLHHMSFKSFLNGAPPPQKNPASTPVPRSSIIFPSFASYKETFKFTEWGHCLFLHGTSSQWSGYKLIIIILQLTQEDVFNPPVPKPTFAKQEATRALTQASKLS